MVPIDTLLLSAARAIDRFSGWLGKLSGILLIALLLNVFYDVIMRYLFNDVSIGMQEMEWHLYSAVFLLGIPYAMANDGHVRVDFLYEHLSPRRRAWVDILGTSVFLVPFSGLVAYYGAGFAYDAYLLGEGSGDPGGLPHRWIIRSVIPFASLAILISGLGVLLASVNILRARHPKPDPEPKSPPHTP